MDIEKEQKKNKELKLVLEDKIKLVRKTENERNQAENDNALLKSEKKVTIHYIIHRLYITVCSFFLKNVLLIDIFLNIVTKFSGKGFCAIQSLF